MKSVLKGIGFFAALILVVIIYLNQEHKIIDADKLYKESEKKVKEANKLHEEDMEKIKELEETLNKKDEEIDKVIKEKDDKIATIHYMDDKKISELENSNKSYKQKYVIVKKDRKKVVAKNLLLMEQIENKDLKLKVKDEMIANKNAAIAKKDETIKKLNLLIDTKDKIYWGKKPKVIGHGPVVSVIRGFDGKWHWGYGYGVYIDVKAGLKRLFKRRL